MEVRETERTCTRDSSKVVFANHKHQSYVQTPGKRHTAFYNKVTCILVLKKLKEGLALTALCSHFNSFTARLFSECSSTPARYFFHVGSVEISC